MLATFVLCLQKLFGKMDRLRNTINTGARKSGVFFFLSLTLNYAVLGEEENQVEQKRSNKRVSAHSYILHSLHHYTISPDSKASPEYSLAYSNSVSVDRKKLFLPFYALSIFPSLPIPPHPLTYHPLHSPNSPAYTISFPFSSSSAFTI